MPLWRIRINIKYAHLLLAAFKTTNSASGNDQLKESILGIKEGNNLLEQLKNALESSKALGESMDVMKDASDATGVSDLLRSSNVESPSNTSANTNTKLPSTEKDDAKKRFVFQREDESFAFSARETQ